MAIAVWAAWAGPVQAPLFKPGARIELQTLAPETTEPDNQSIHEKDDPSLRAQMVPKLYALHVSNSWLETALAAEVPARRQIAAKNASGHAKDVLAQSPVNGFGWVALATAAEERGNSDEATALLTISRIWTPFSRDLALPRILLEIERWDDMSFNQQAKLLDELALAARGERRQTLMALIKTSPALANLWERSLARRKTIRMIERELNP
ncbi:MAG: hypothetical protein AAGI03_02320 [Pseudomonadota bacterium]